jgi:hypothetical protein
VNLAHGANSSDELSKEILCSAVEAERARISRFFDDQNPFTNILDGTDQFSPDEFVVFGGLLL